MIEISQIATNLERGERGIWFSKSRTPVSFPKDGHAQCLAVEENSFWFEHRNNFIIEALRMYPPGGVIFDIGGGNGYLATQIVKAGMDVILVEPGLEGAINAHARGLDTIVCSTLEDAGFKANTLPAIGIFDVLEHIEDDMGFLRTISALLVRNGRLYITVPAYDFLFSVVDERAGHYRRYTIKSVTSALESIGFSIEFRTYIFGLLPIPIFLFRTAPSRLGLRKRVQTGRTQKEHVQSGYLFGRLMNRLLGLEIDALRKRRRIPFGGSCFIAARIPKAEDKEKTNESCHQQ